MKRFGSLVVLGCVVAGLAAGPAVAADGPVAHWRFDEGSGLTAADSSGNGLDATLNAGTSWVSGKRTGAVHFDGVTGVARVPSDPLLEPAAITVSAWLKRSGSPGNYKYILGKGALGCMTASYGLYSGPGGGLAFYVSDGSTFERSPDAGMAAWDGAWHHVAGSFDGQRLRLYVDGVQVGTGTPWGTPINYQAQTAEDLLLGDYAGCGGLAFEGTIDEPKIWGRALSASEVLADMRFAFQGFFAPVDNLPVVNVAKAGSAVPVKFSLTGYQGMAILAAGSPTSKATACDGGEADTLEQVATTSQSGLTYDAASDRYQYVWKTDKAWSGQCREFQLQLTDGSVHTAAFRFVR